MSNKPKYRSQERPYIEDINDLIEKGWMPKFPKPGFGYQSNKDAGKVQGVGGGKFEATDAQGNKINQKYGNANEAKQALEAKQHDVEKGGPGSGKRGHTTSHPETEKHFQQQGSSHEQKTMRRRVLDKLQSKRENEDKINKLKEIHAYHKENSSKETQEEMKRYLNPKATDSYAHSVRVEDEHRTMTRRSKENK